MDNTDFVAHLASTAHALEVSMEAVENLVRSYYHDMHAVTTKWHGYDLRDDGEAFKQAFSELNAAFEKYWLPGTRFTDYWQPAMEPPEMYDIVDTGGVTIFSDMLGNFASIVRTADRTTVYLLTVVRDELKIVNKFFR